MHAGVGFTHVTGEVKRMLGKILSIDQDNFPEMLGHTCIINAGSVISFLFRFIKPMLDIRTQNKIEVRPGRAVGSEPTGVLVECQAVGHPNGSSAPTAAARTEALPLRS